MTCYRIDHKQVEKYENKSAKYIISTEVYKIEKY